jgi:hypothetical protein
MPEPMRTLWETEEPLASTGIRTHYHAVHGTVTSPTNLALLVSRESLFRQNYKEEIRQLLLQYAIPYYSWFRRHAGGTVF